MEHVKIIIKHFNLLTQDILIGIIHVCSIKNNEQNVVVTFAENLKKKDNSDKKVITLLFFRKDKYMYIRHSWLLQKKTCMLHSRNTKVTKYWSELLAFELWQIYSCKA